MKLPALLVSDPHFTANPADEYRWGLWPWLRTQLDAEKAKTLLILGDLTDAKDYHPSALVNRICKEITETKKHVDRVVILMGNHDYLKGGDMFFRFLSLQRGVDVITRPTESALNGEATAIFMPHTRNPARDWKDFDFSHYQYMFMHQTVRGATSESGQELDGERMPPLTAGKTFSGDIHVPQHVGPVEYVGSPYAVHHGDSFKPRCVVLDRDGKQFDLHYKTVSRGSIEVRSIDALREVARSFKANDQVKVRIVLTEGEKHRWSAMRREAAELLEQHNLVVNGLKLEVDRSGRSSGFAARPVSDPRDALIEFVEANALGGDLLDAGLDCLEGT